jgi:hypothetical protein
MTQRETREPRWSRLPGASVGGGIHPRVASYSVLSEAALAEFIVQGEQSLQECEALNAK